MCVEASTLQGWSVGSAMGAEAWGKLSSAKHTYLSCISPGLEQAL